MKHLKSILKRRTGLACACVCAALVLAAYANRALPQAGDSDTPAETPAAAQPSAAEQSLGEHVLNASPYSIAASEELSAFVTTTAEAAVAEHCAGCHGADLTGAPGVPNLVDFEWIWGVTFEEANDVGPVMEIMQTILYGVRNEDCDDIADVSFYGACADTRFSQMPGYLALGAFTEEQTSDMTEYVMALGGMEADAAAAARAEPLWAICIECHGVEGYGYKPYGGPDLTDDVWLFGADRDTIYDVIANGRVEKCPPWKDTLDAATIKALAVYIWRRVQGG